MGLGIVFRSMEPGQYLRLLQGISILWMRREKSQSSRKRWTDHLGDLPTFRKPFEKASSTLAGKAKGGVEGIWAKVKVFDIFLLSRLLLLSDRDDRDGALASSSSTHPATAVACEKGGKKLFVEEKRAYSITGKNSVSLSQLSPSF